MAKRRVLYQGYTFEIAYIFDNRRVPKNLVFLHGWGSSKELMQTAFKAFFNHYNHFYLDLPGFGKSPNHIFLTPRDYAKIVDAFFDSLQVEIDMAIGHSFGGKVALLCRSTNLVLLSTAGILIPKSFTTRFKIKLAKSLKALGLKKALGLLASKDAHNLNQAMYETFKYTVQEDFEEQFKACKKPTLILWGQEDTTTPLEAGQRIASLVPKNCFFVLKGDHYFFLKQGLEVERRCLEYFQEG
ncbi:alpha/beta fold hydrolase [Helicobacter suis]|uniref:2-hydroxy-6-oxohepta-2,4-dienoate hydrolase n=2 Tax=Helicobacter suis TaxID=104628 RepID=E7G417_9HELI|nr:alpha/beta hydrolase [Helicobacter suis]EFX41870.1 2-hydroxy-6-oxohepta-2,4-dienoate hydrolase [Helicobacter suis HS5]EFX43181.1 2-hydroxy-6-oxohepta-2,4-dienoate hydrolase [Helicobacter suis HS1]BCD45748.1 2-hydroxy-6-oxohepta-2,4-dienoate hydrolase EtsV [Helicobacter suis]BCD48323.1 2-hydroxy-6-oxohepta-2,4-dienoate hydrolase EtsV [Helicobacter suis]BCD50084.1 2-hydroxy-6-oxohepta-2,4-dienoate hydrolase EtsV [Helicobacter suis]